MSLGPWSMSPRDRFCQSITNDDKVHAAKVLNRLGLADFFDGIICFETLNPPSKSTETNNEWDTPTINSTTMKTPIICKPSKEVVEQALRLANVDLQRTIFFDDSTWNIATGKHAVSIWRPIPPHVYAIIGDSIVEGLDPPSLGVVLRDDDSGHLEKPVKFKKTQVPGKDLEDAFMLFLVAPPSYVSLGCIASRSTTLPPLDIVHCVRMDLVNQASRMAYGLAETGKQKLHDNFSGEMKIGCLSITLLDNLRGMVTPLVDNTLKNTTLAAHGRLEALNVVFVSSVAASLSVLLFSRLFLYYEASQFFYSYVSYILFLLVSMSWFIDSSFCIIPASKSIDCIRLRKDLRYIDISLLMGLPSLLSHTVFLPTKGYSILAIPSLLIFVLAVASSYIVPNIFAPQALYALWVTIFLAFATLFIGYLGSHTDKKLYDTIKLLQESLSERKVKEEEAIQPLEWNKAEYVGKINQMKQYISFILHEIRVSVNAVVLGIGHMLAGSLSDEQWKILKMMDASSSLMIHILNDVLDIDKIEAGKLQLEKQPFNMGELVSSLIRAFNPRTLCRFVCL